MVYQCFDSFLNSRTKYKNLYFKLRQQQKEHFKQDKGSYIALVKLTKDDGVADFPKENNYGHYTFHEYSETSLEAKVLDFYNIFKEDGEFNI